MTNLHEQRAAVIEAAQSIINGVKGRDLNTEEIATLEAKQADLGRIDGLIEKSARSSELMSAFQVSGTNPATTPATSAKTAGQHFIKNANVASLKGAPGQVAAEFKADARHTGGVEGVWGTRLTEQDPDLVRLHKDPLTVADLLGSKPTNAVAVQYMVQNLQGKEGGPDFRTEGQPGARMRFGSWTPQIEMIKDLAVVTEVSDEVFADLPYVASIIDDDLRHEMRLAEEETLLNATGGPSAITGLLHRSIQVMEAQGMTDLYAALFRGANRINQATGMRADAVIINPLDYEQLVLLKDGDGRFLHSTPMINQHFSSRGLYGEGVSLLGLNTVVTPAIAQGTALIGDFRRGADILRRQGLVVEASNIPKFDSWETTIRARMRFGLGVKRPGAFCKITMA